MKNFLEEMIRHKKEVLEREKKRLSLDRLLKLLDKPLPAARFQEKIARRGIHLIAELKKASPSSGVIAEDFDLMTIAAAYEKGGASCLSVLTADKYFLGNISFLDKLRAGVHLPLLRKDFIIDAYQLYESKLHGADAVLLIVTILDENTIKHFLKINTELKLDTVLEVHNEDELKKALDSGAKTIGINTRNLIDFSVDLSILPALLEKIPSGYFVVCESGIKTIDDLAAVKSPKVSAVLVGETLMRAKDPASKVREFVDYLER